MSSSRREFLAKASLARVSASAILALERAFDVWSERPPGF